MAFIDLKSMSSFSRSYMYWCVFYKCAIAYVSHMVNLIYVYKCKLYDWIAKQRMETLHNRLQFIMHRTCHIATIKGGFSLKTKI